MPRRIVYVTGTRADFGLMRTTLGLLDADPRLELGLYVTGAHLSSAFGETVTEIEQAGFRILRKVPIPLGAGTRVEMAQGVAAALSAFAEALGADRPDLVLLLGDRGEMLAGALAATYHSIPTAHIHGGELSGTVDEPIRHAISKLAHLHLASTAGARDRLIRMGERGDRIVVCGAPGLDDILAAPRMARDALSAEWRLDPGRPICLLVMHPVVQSAETAGEQMRQTLEGALALSLQILVLRSNADAGGQRINAVLDGMAAEAGLRIATHLPREVFISWLDACDVLLGNSSAGVIEAASFGTPVVNVGDRQNGRERNHNVLDVPPERDAVAAALRAALAGGRFPRENLYGDGCAGERIRETLAGAPLPRSLLHKINAY